LVQVQHSDHRGRPGKSKFDMEFGQNEHRSCQQRSAIRGRLLEVALWCQNPPYIVRKISVR
jgi:hypothetical protein